MSGARPSDGTASGIASVFVQARRTGEPLGAFPGPLPDGLEKAYAIQQAAIDQWPDRIAGWKVGRIMGDLEQRLGVNRFLGPIFADSVMRAQIASEVDFPVIVGGFAALEVELIAVVGQDQRADKVDRSQQEARAAICDLHVGIEVAGSPLGSIHALGALASIAGFGNNGGLIVGPGITDFLSRPVCSMAATTRIDGAEKGHADASALPGGIWTAVAFALDQAARMGRPMRAGDYISTGALTGVHPVGAGQHCTADFGEDGILHCVVVPVGRG